MRSYSPTECPREWIDDVKQANEDSLLGLSDHLPQEAAEALLEIATGGKPEPALAVADPAASGFQHPDAQRRFRLFTDEEELRQALEYPWEKWTVFLHPSQRQTIERSYSGSARVSGSAGTGKTIVALHRAVHLAKTHSDSKVLLTTFSEALAGLLRQKLDRLTGGAAHKDRIGVSPLNDIAGQLYQEYHGEVSL